MRNETKKHLSMWVVHPLFHLCEAEVKKQMTSHEMRNPLSAILQCADGIAESLTDFLSDEKTSTMSKALADSNLDAAQTIVLCAQHQKRSE